MSLNKDDISRVGYQAKIDWYKERVAGIADGTITLQNYLKDKSTDFEATKHTPEELIGILDDIQKKATKLDGKIAYLSAGLIIPIDTTKQPELAASVNSLDPSSKGEYISYTLYDTLRKESDYANSKVTLDYLVSNTTGDQNTDSIIVKDAILSGYASYGAQTQASTNDVTSTVKMYANRWLNNAISWNEHDYQIQQILNFSDNYLDMFPDPSYIPWSARRETGAERVDAKNLSDLWKFFSEDYSGKINNMVSGVGDLAALQPDATIHDLTTRYIVYANQYLNKLNEIFDMQWPAHLVCCFMQWGIQLDTKTLKGLRALLQLFQTGLSFDFKDILNGIKDILNNILRGLLTNQLVAFITQILQKICDPIKEWINNPDETWRKIFACTPIAELIQTYITQALDYVQLLLTNLIQNWYKQLEIKNIEQNLKIDIFTKQKIAGDLAKLLDGIIAAIDLAAKCGIQASPNSESVQQVIADYNINDPTKYQFPVESNPNIYNSFIVDNPEVTSPQSAAEPLTAALKPQSPGGITEKSYAIATSLDECLKRVPVEEVTGVKEWIAKIETELKRSS